MTKPVFAFFNNKGGVGKTTLVYNLAWMFQDMGHRVIAVDLDPQANLTAAFLDDDRLEELWPEDDHPDTIFGAIQPLLKGIGDIRAPHLEPIAPYLNLLVGDLQLSTFEDELSSQWPGCLDRKERSFRVISAFWRLIQKAVISQSADFALIDLGPNLGALNRAALIAADFVIVPLGPDLYSLQGLRNLGPTLRRWQEEWQERLGRNPEPNLTLPSGTMKPLGYIVLQHSVRLDRPVKSYNRWMNRIPEVYFQAVLQRDKPSKNQNEYNLAMIKHYHSLMPMAQEAHKPIFHLKPADGAIGSHYQSVQDTNDDFKKLALNILARAKL
ncbi:MAG: ParA family protein [Bacteroidales bacterium]